MANGQSGVKRIKDIRATWKDLEGLRVEVYDPNGKRWIDLHFDVFIEGQFYRITRRGYKIPALIYIERIFYRGNQPRMNFLAMRSEVELLLMAEYKKFNR